MGKIIPFPSARGKKQVTSEPSEAKQLLKDAEDLFGRVLHDHQMGRQEALRLLEEAEKKLSKVPDPYDFRAPWI